MVIDLDSTAVGSRTALTGGEDHALLAAFPSEAALPSGFRAIGRVLPAASAPALHVDGRPFDARGGWDPYADWDGQTG